MYTDSSSIKGDSTIITIHPATINLPLKGKTQGIHDCMQKTCVCTQISQEKPCTRDCELKTCIQEEKCIKMKENR